MSKERKGQNWNPFRPFRPDGGGGEEERREEEEKEKKIHLFATILSHKP